MIGLRFLAFTALLAAVLAILAVVVYLWKLPNFKEQASDDSPTENVTAAQALRHPHVLFGVMVRPHWIFVILRLGVLMVFGNKA